MRFWKRRKEKRVVTFFDDALKKKKTLPVIVCTTTGQTRIALGCGTTILLSSPIAVEVGDQRVMVERMFKMEFAGGVLFFRADDKLRVIDADPS